MLYRHLSLFRRVVRGVRSERAPQRRYRSLRPRALPSPIVPLVIQRSSQWIAAIASRHEFERPVGLVVADCLNLAWMLKVSNEWSIVTQPMVVSDLKIERRVIVITNDDLKSICIFCRDGS